MYLNNMWSGLSLSSISCLIAILMWKLISYHMLLHVLRIVITCTMFTGGFHNVSCHPWYIPCRVHHQSCHMSCPPVGNVSNVMCPVGNMSHPSEMEMVFRPLFAHWFDWIWQTYGSGYKWWVVTGVPDISWRWTHQWVFGGPLPYPYTIT